MTKDSKTCFAVNLTPADLAMFSKLGITVELLKRAGIERVTDTEAREKYGIAGSGDMAGIAFPISPRTVYGVPSVCGVTTLRWKAANRRGDTSWLMATAAIST